MGGCGAEVRGGGGVPWSPAGGGGGRGGAGRGCYRCRSARVTR